MSQTHSSAPLAAAPPSTAFLWIGRWQEDDGRVQSRRLRIHCEDPCPGAEDRTSARVQRILQEGRCRDDVCVTQDVVLRSLAWRETRVCILDLVLDRIGPGRRGETASHDRLDPQPWYRPLVHESCSRSSDRELLRRLDLPDLIPGGSDGGILLTGMPC